MRTRSLALFLFSSSSSSSSTRTFLSLFSSLSSTAITTSSNSGLVDCLTNTYKLSKTQATSISNRFSWAKSPNINNPQIVHKYFLELGFSETQIRSVIIVSPEVLFLNVNKNLKPKVEFFNKQLGIETSDLGKFISWKPTLLKHSLKNNLIPTFQILKKFFESDGNSQNFIRLFHRDRRLFWTTPKALLANCDYLESCGIVGPQFSLVLKACPQIILLSESKLRDLVSRVLDMGFSLDSGMLHHALRSLNGMSKETFKKKMELLGSFGFSESERMEMFRRTPTMPAASEEKLKFGIDYFLNTVGFKKSMLIHYPYLLKFGMKKRVIPRYEVLQVLKLKKLLKREPSFYNMLLYSENDFLEKFVLRFKDDAEELLEAYSGHISDSSEEEES